MSTTIRDIIERSLRRAKLLDSTESISGTDANYGLDVLNDMVASWSHRSVNVAHIDFTLSDELLFFVAPKPDYTQHLSEGRIAGALASQNYKGLWDASTNTPALVTGAGTVGDLYRASVAGSTTIDSVTTQAVGDYVIFDGYEWLKGQPSRPHARGVIAMLAVQMAEENGSEIGQVVARDAAEGWASIQAPFALPGAAQFDPAIEHMTSQRYWGYITT